MNAAPITVKAISAARIADDNCISNVIYTAVGVAQPDLIARGAVYGQMLGFAAEITQVPIVGSSAHV